MPYIDPVVKKEHDRQYYQTHKAAIKLRGQIWAANNREKSRASEKKYRLSHSQELKDRQQWRNLHHPEEHKRSVKKYLLGLRMAALTAYSPGTPRCACCGTSYLEFLAIDHENGGGGAHRRQIGVAAGSSFYRWLKTNGYPEGFRVLCHNCNASRGYYGYCPHETDQGAGL